MRKKKTTNKLTSQIFWFGKRGLVIMLYFFWCEFAVVWQCYTVSSSWCYWLDMMYACDSHGPLILNIAITHVFSCINICRIPKALFEREAAGWRFKHLKRDPANVSAFYLIPENDGNSLKNCISYVESRCKKWRQLAKSNVKTSFPLKTSTSTKA